MTTTETVTKHTPGPVLAICMDGQEALSAKCCDSQADADTLQQRAARDTDHDIDVATVPLRVAAVAPELLEALKTWEKFWDTMPKGQMGKLVFDVGLLNDGFIKTRAALAKAGA